MSYRILSVLIAVGLAYLSNIAGEKFGVFFEAFHAAHNPFHDQQSIGTAVQLIVIMVVGIFLPAVIAVISVLLSIMTLVERDKASIALSSAAVISLAYCSGMSGNALPLLLATCSAVVLLLASAAVAKLPQRMG